jgi:hypothetical protein
VIVEERTYTLHPGKIPENFRLHESEERAIQPLIRTRESKILVPTAFSPIR